MLFRTVSDVHIERFRHSTVPVGMKWDEFFVPIQPRDAESVLLIAGDFCEFADIMFFAACFKSLAARFKAVVYVPGNHEYFCKTAPYGKATFFYFKELLRRYGKIHLLDNSSVVIDGVKIYGTTLWTNYDDKPTTELTMSRMTDFNYAYTMDNGTTRLTKIQDYIDRHHEARRLLEAALESGEEMVVVSHFAPSHQSIHEKYKNIPVQTLNLHFVNELDQLIMDSPQIKLWLHGHTHTPFDYMIGDTRVVCNPTGFEVECNNPTGELMYIDVDIGAPETNSENRNGPVSALE